MHTLCIVLMNFSLTLNNIAFLGLYSKLYVFTAKMHVLNVDALICD